MNLEELFNILNQDDVKDKLSGTITFEATHIKWEYDGLLNNNEIDFDDYLYYIYDNDLEIIKEYVDEDEFYISNPEIDDTFIIFYIEK